jgi:hypothetical protein
MIYQVELTVPPQTPRDSPCVEEVMLPEGKITRLAILFPAGCAALARVIILHNERQVWPTSPEQSFCGDYMYMEFQESYLLEDPWNRFQVLAWNDDDSYPHTVDVWLEVKPKEEGWTWPALFGMPRYVEEMPEWPTR